MYLNEAQVSLTGYVATQPSVKTVSSGAMYTSMRVAWTPRRQDRDTGEWVDGNTSYATVICWRKLATHIACSLRKGDPVMVRGRLSIRNYDDKNGVRRIAVEVEATSVGHDLSRGVAIFQRTRAQTGLTAAQLAALTAGGAGTAGQSASDGASAVYGPPGNPASPASPANGNGTGAHAEAGEEVRVSAGHGGAGQDGAGQDGAGHGGARDGDDGDDMHVADVPLPDSAADLDDPFLDESRPGAADRADDPVAVPF